MIENTYAVTGVGEVRAAVEEAGYQLATREHLADTGHVHDIRFLPMAKARGFHEQEN